MILTGKERACGVFLRGPTALYVAIRSRTGVVRLKFSDLRRLSLCIGRYTCSRWSEEVHA